jgi:hypothetical protein
MSGPGQARGSAKSAVLARRVINSTVEFSGSRLRDALLTLTARGEAPAPPSSSNRRAELETSASVDG